MLASLPERANPCFRRVTDVEGVIPGGAAVIIGGRPTKGERTDLRAKIEKDTIMGCTSRPGPGVHGCDVARVGASLCPAGAVLLLNAKLWSGHVARRINTADEAHVGHG